MDEIKFESYTRIEHMLTGCWLHALKGIYNCIWLMYLDHYYVSHTTRN